MSWQFLLFSSLEVPVTVWPRSTVEKPENDRPEKHHVQARPDLSLVVFRNHIGPPNWAAHSFMRIWLCTKCSYNSSQVGPNVRAIGFTNAFIRFRPYYSSTGTEAALGNIRSNFSCEEIAGNDKNVQNTFRTDLNQLLKIDILVTATIFHIR